MEHETLKEIPGYDGYSISPNGDVFSNKRGHLRKLKPFLDGRGKYLLIGLIGNDGRRRKVLVHRLVAICYIPNPNKLPEVNHKDKNTQNSSMENLEWCTRKDNLCDSYTTMSPARNTRKCKLFKGSSLVGEFESIHAAVAYAEDTFGANRYSLEKYLCTGDISIVSKGRKERKVQNRNRSGKTYNQAPIHVIRASDGIEVGVFRTGPEAAAFFRDILKINASSRIIQKKYSQNKPIEGYIVKRERQKSVTTSLI